MAAPSELARDDAKRHRHAVDLWRESFDDEDECHEVLPGDGVIFRLRLQGVRPMCHSGVARAQL